MKETWFYESLFPSVRLGLKVKGTLVSNKSPYQKINILDTYEFGKVLVLDGVVQTTERDEFIYHEMLTHLPMLSHPHPERVLIIGGGDGGILREVLKYPVKEVSLVEIDKKVIEFSKSYLSAICKNSFNDRRANIIIDDGVNFVKERKRKFDVIIVDSSDPIGPAKVLFSSKFYRDTFNTLSHNNGTFAQQTGSPFLQREELPYVYRRLKKIFPFVSTFSTAVPTYIGGLFSFVFASKGIDPLKIRLWEIEKRYRKLRLKTRYYNPEIHHSSFTLPTYIKEAVEAKRNG
ncbi:MAG TPA: polyamine aminopropyltransferase [bacterium]|nr:polyamine aminopropyltransferase [bacterium]